MVEDPTTTPTPEQRRRRRLCDYCAAAPALLYCRADSAKLCLPCDRDVHSTNPLFTKHTRSLLCDLCDASSASIFSEAHRSVLCGSCDWEAHDAAAVNNHNRRPIEGFSGCPSSDEILVALGFDEGKDALLGGGGGFADSLLWETPTFVSLDNLIVSSENFGGFQALDVPPLPKNRNATCGKHKEEIVRQVQMLARSETCLNFENVEGFEPEPDLQFLDLEPTSVPRDTYRGREDHEDAFSVPDPEGVAFQWLSDGGEMKNQASNSLTFLSSCLDEDLKNPEKQPEIGGLSCANQSCEVQPENPVTEDSPPILPRVGQFELNSQERESAISRYKEKRKTRRYEKHIRYESRKVRAESRTRVRGRFAKVTSSVNIADRAQKWYRQVVFLRQICVAELEEAYQKLCW